jgi:hypothetical protein
MRLYLTHCCKDKSETARLSGDSLLPDELYVDPAIQAFFQAVKQKGQTWGVLSDLYGLWLPPRREGWYEKHPDTVTTDEAEAIRQSFDEGLEAFTEVWFYVRKETFHPFYQSVLERSRWRDRIQCFESLKKIPNS